MRVSERVREKDGVERVRVNERVSERAKELVKERVWSQNDKQTRFSYFCKFGKFGDVGKPWDRTNEVCVRRDRR